MRFHVLTIFPHLLESPLQEGILRRALLAEKIEVALVNIRDFAMDKHAMTDDRPFGGGEGMVMKPEPLAEAIRRVTGKYAKAHVVLLSPQGRRYNQAVATEFACLEDLVLICGRYEGVDERIRRHYVDEEISIGDYVLTGGELAAMVIIDSVTRLLPGVLGCEDSVECDTFSRRGVKYPQYTRPRDFEGHEVPEVLLSGDHMKIAEWRFAAGIRMTQEKRPDLLSAMTFDKKELKILKKYGVLLGKSAERRN